MSANERLGRLFMSAPVTYAYQTWYPTPGLFWEDLVLKDCGHPRCVFLVALICWCGRCSCLVPQQKAATMNAVALNDKGCAD